MGFILNVPSNVSLGFVALPLRRQHWLAVRQHRGTYYNLDSKLPAPVAIGGEEELRWVTAGDKSGGHREGKTSVTPFVLPSATGRAFLRDFLSQGLCEVFLVVPRAVEESGAWLSPE